MSGIFGLLGIEDTDRVFVSTVGQDIVYDASAEIIARYNAELASVLSFFVGETTEDFKLRYKLPGGGRLQRLGKQAPSAEVRAVGEWDVAFPLEGFGAAQGGNRVDLSYMTIADLDRHLDTVMIQDQNTVRFELLKALLNDAQDTFRDDLHGNLLIEPLANGDAVLYPPVFGTEDEATEDHYISTGSALPIADANNPFPTIRDELEEHFGAPTGGSNIVCFISNSDRSAVEGLAGFVEVVDRFIVPGDDTAVPIALPPNMPGAVIGRTDGCWIVEYRWMPAAYVLGLHMDAPKPLAMRRDPSDTALPQGLNLVATNDKYPLQDAYWEHRFGLGATNRINGVAVFVDAGSWAVPTAYA